MAKTKPLKKILAQYAEDILSGKIITGKYQRRFVERHFYDLKTGKDRDLYFDEDAGERVINFFQFLKHSKGKWAGQTFDLSPWQKFLLYVLFGWKKISTKKRRFRLAFNLIARKNGKSTLAAGVGLYLLIADGEAGAEIYSAATKKDQARIVHEEARRMARASTDLQELCTVVRDNIHVLETLSKFEPLSSEDDSLDGLNVHGAIIDEMHAHKTRAVFDVLDTATGAREQPLIFVITTAGFNKVSVAAEMRDYARKILDGFDAPGGMIDDTFFAFLAEIDDGDDWQDEKVWIKANPNLGISASLEDLRGKCLRAQQDPSAQNSFRCKHLNEWTSQETRFIPIQVWDRGARPLEIAKGDLCYGGLDLADSQDLCAWVMVFPKPDGSYHVLPRFWIPENTIKKKTVSDRANYQSWVSQNFIKTTPGDTVEYDYIIKQILDDSEFYNVKEIAFDRWGAAKLSKDLADKGKLVIPFGQGFAMMSSPTKELLNLTLTNKIIHAGNPVLRWNADNVITVMDPAGNIKPAKNKSTQRIDGIVALIMGIDRAIRIGNAISVYQERELLVL